MDRKKKRKRRHDSQPVTIPLHPAPSESKAGSSSTKKSKKDHCTVRGPSGNDMAEDVKLVTSTGSILTLQSAGHVLSRYLNSFGRNPADFHQDVTFTIVPMPNPPQRTKPPKSSGPRPAHQPPPDSLFLCTLALPVGCPLSPMISPGVGYQSKDAAKKRVTFEMVRTLINIGEVDQNLQPRPRSVPPKESRKDTRYERIASRIESRFSSPLASPPPEDNRTPMQRIKSFRDGVNAALPPRKPALNGMPGVADYENLTEAAFWSTCEPFTTDNAYVTLFTVLLASPNDAKNPFRPMAFLTTRPLDIFDNTREKDIDISMPKVGSEEINVDAVIRLKPAGRLPIIDQAGLENAVKFTEQLVRSHVHKDVHLHLPNAKWLLLTLRPDFDLRPDAANVVSNGDVAWDEVARGAGPFCTPFPSFQPKDLEAATRDALVTTHVEFTRRYTVRAVRTDLSPSSPIPGDSDKTPLMEQLVTPPPLQHPYQPILEGEVVYPCKSGGSVASVVFPPVVKFLIPELTAIHCVSASVSRATSNLPQFLTALDNFMIAKQLAHDCFDDIITPEMTLIALSAPVAHGLAPEKNYQRLEFLGDTLLKLITSVYLLQVTPETPADWEKLHMDRQVMVSNRTLHNKALQAGLPQFIRTSRTKAKDWSPAGWEFIKVPGAKSVKSETIHSLGDKTIADVAEALVAAGYESAPEGERIDRAIQVMHKLRLLSPQFRRWGDLTSQVFPTAKAIRPLSMPLMLFGHPFREPRRGREALSMSAERSHRSAFQRYKTIGDAVLDYLIVGDLFANYPMALAGALSNMRHSRHGESCLAAFCACSGLLDLLTEVPVDVLPNITEFKRNIRRAQKHADLINEQPPSAEFWKEVPPQHYLGEVVTALFGAILLDVQWDLAALRRVYERQLAPFLDKYCIGPRDHSWHPRGIIGEAFAARGCISWSVDDLGRRSEVDPFETTVTMHGHQVGLGYAETQLVAMRKACDMAITRIRSDRLLETLCDCPKRKKATTKFA